MKRGKQTNCLKLNDHGPSFCRVLLHKFYIISLLCVLAFNLLLLPSANAATPREAPDIRIFVGKMLLQMADPPVIVEGRTLVPMRVLFEALGATVTWESNANTAVGVRGGIEVRVAIGSRVPTVNGRVVPLDVAARIWRNRTYIPLRFVAEAFGDAVTWDESTRTITITRRVDAGTTDPLPNRPPTAAITSPPAGTTVEQGAAITFRGSATDPEDRTLTGTALVWTSNIAGQLGTGESFTRTLPVGTHIITLTATDSARATGIASMTIIVQPQPDREVTFPDPNLERVIRTAINRPTGAIRRSDLVGVGHISVDDRNISNLAGLEHLTNLTALSLWDTQVSDITPLARLTNLTSLNLNVSQVRDITPLYGLTSLISLQLEHNQVSDITSLRGLINLKSLTLRNNQIRDITPLARLTNLNSLRLDQNQISDITSLRGLINLTSLELDNNQISDITSLHGLINLRSLSLSNNQIRDIAPLAGLTKLGGLWLTGNEHIYDIAPLAKLTNLNLLWLSSDRIRDITPLVGLIKLMELSLWGNQINDITPLAGMTNLMRLYMDNNQIRDITALVGLIDLRSLTLGGNQIRDITPLARLTNLTWLRLNQNQISDITPLTMLTNLSALFLYQNQISDISPLVGLTSLSELALDGNQIRDLAPLVANAGIGAGDSVILLEGNPLNLTPGSQNMRHIEELRRRGVSVR